jgi:hypothetical protein
MTGPFGLHMGMRLEEIGVPEKSTYELHQFDNLPSGHPFFTKYMLSIAPTAGLFHVNAWQEFHDGNASEANLRGTFEELRGAFEEFFGSSTAVDESRFIEGIRCLELSAVWTRSRGARLYDDVTTIILSVHQDHRTYGTVKAQFFYSNFLRAQSEVQGFAAPAPTAPSARVGTSAPAHEPAPATESIPSAAVLPEPDHSSTSISSSASSVAAATVNSFVDTFFSETVYPLASAASPVTAAPSTSEPSPAQVPNPEPIARTAAPAPPSVPAKVPIERKVTSVVVGSQKTGPFGLSMGMLQETIGRAPRIVSGSLQLYDTLPMGDELFNQYRLTFGTNTGLCRVSALRKGISMLDGGVTLRNEFLSVVDRYQELYGPYIECPRPAGSGYTTFIRTIAAWTSGSDTDLPKDVVAIDIEAVRTSDGEGAVCVNYVYSNYIEFKDRDTRGTESAPSPAHAPNPEPIKRTVAPAPPSAPAKVPIERKVTSVVVGGQKTGPFGLSMGMPPGALGQPQRVVSSSVLEYNTLPKGHDLFNKYQLTFCSMIGLCHVAAFRMGIRMSNGGYTLASEFRNVISRYEALYGPSTQREQTISSSGKGYFNIIAVWTSGSGAPLPKDVASIEIEAVRAANGDGVVCVNYYYTNSTMSKDQLQSTPKAASKQQDSMVNQDRYL